MCPDQQVFLPWTPLGHLLEKPHPRLATLQLAKQEAARRWEPNSEPFFEVAFGDPIDHTCVCIYIYYIYILIYWCICLFECALIICLLDVLKLVIHREKLATLWDHSIRDPFG